MSDLHMKSDVAREALWCRQADEVMAAAYPAQGRASGPDWRLGFREGWGVSREALLSDDAVLRALNAEEPRAATDNLADWGEESIARMRAALAAALREDENDA